ncbi:MAG: putative Holliday junction resolvase [Planctomycetota bacterium]|jgi:putative Holliday junction resolvase
MSTTAKSAALGIDHGDKRTGFALTDAGRIRCGPLDVFHGPGDGDALLQAIADRSEEYRVGTFVVGYPLNMDGTPGGRVAIVDAFIQRLQARFPDALICRQDERLTTKEAEERLRESGHHGAARKARRDSWSAWVLLEDWVASGEPKG